MRNRTQMVDATGTTTYSYDEVNRLTSVTFPGSRTVGYSYSNAGNRATMTYPGGSNQVTYGYDAANNLTSVTDWNSNQTTYTYNNAGMLTTVTVPSGTGIVGSYSYDNADRLTGISWVKDGSTTVKSVSYTLDPTGNRKQRVDGLGTHSYTFDALYRLTVVDYPTGTDDSFTYDAVGNRLTKNSDDYTYDAADRLTALEGVSYGYDDNGNLTSRGSDRFSWDAANRLISATVNSATTTFAYNGDGLRDSLTFNSNTTTFTWDIAAGLPLLLDDEDFRYVYGAAGRISEVGPSTTTRYYLADALGSVMALVDSSGSVLNTYEYDVFGAVRSSTGSTGNAFTFTGEQTDAGTGLEYLRARYYDSASGRFLSLDPMGDGYDYAYDNPVSNTDPSGLCVSAAVKAGVAAWENPFKPGSLAWKANEKSREHYLSQATCGGKLLEPGGLPDMGCPGDEWEEVDYPQLGECGSGSGRGAPDRGSNKPTSAPKVRLPEPTFTKIDAATARHFGVKEWQMRDAVHNFKEGEGLPKGMDIRIGKSGRIYNPNTGDVLGNIVDELIALGHIPLGGGPSW